MKVRTFSLPDGMDRLMRDRKEAEGMTLSEYLRKCVREEAERNKEHFDWTALGGSTPNVLYSADSIRLHW